MDTIRVALIEDDSATREGLRMLIDGAEGFQCAGAFSSAEEGLRRLRSRPDVLTSLALAFHRYPNRCQEGQYSLQAPTEFLLRRDRYARHRPPGSPCVHSDPSTR